jgi:hypothetical protein
MTDSRRMAISLIENLIARKILVSEVLDSWPKAEHDQKLEQIRCLLEHYRSDLDIRAGDKRYAEWEESQLSEYIRDLQQG